MKKHLYLDNNATTQILPQVRSAMFDIMDCPINASSPHALGRKAKFILEAARAKVLLMVGGDSKYQVIFTSCGTEANNMALRGLEGFKVLVSVTEHASVLKNVMQAVIPVDKNGIVKLDELRQLLAINPGNKLVSIHYANNETGVIQPIAEIVKIAHEFGALVHTDATQAFGKVPFNAQELDVDMITLSAHKFGGPLGAGALVFKKNLPLMPMMIGGGQEIRFRPGTHNLPAIHGFGIACELERKYREQMQATQKLRDFIIHSLPSDAVIFGANSPRLPNTISIALPGVASETQVIHFDTNSIAISAGSACSSGKVDLPYVQMSMGYEEAIARSVIRVSFGVDNTLEDAKTFFNVWETLYKNTILNKSVS